MEKNKWYKTDSGTIGFYRGMNNESYGFHCQNNEWIQHHRWFFEGVTFHEEKWFLAPELEVFEALEKESKNRGFGDTGVFFTDVNGHEAESKIKGVIFWNKELSEDDSLRWNVAVADERCVIYREGQWATIIPIITKAEAEKRLRVKII